MPLTLLTFYLHCACGFVTQILAHMLDSLVRVSRRVNEGHFVSIQTPRRQLTRRRATLKHSMLSKNVTRPDHFTSKSRGYASVRDTTRYELTVFEPFPHREPMLTYSQQQ